MNDDIVKMFDTNELNRLQRCAKNKDKKEILKWGQDFEKRIAQFYMKEYKTIEELEKDIIEYIDYYNNKRIKSKLKGMSPVQYRTHSQRVA